MARKPKYGKIIENYDRNAKLYYFIEKTDLSMAIFDFASIV